MEVGPYRVHTLESGAGAEAVILLHGLSGSGRWWRHTIPALARRYRVLVPDLIGFGATGCPGPLPEIAALAEILAEWATQTAAWPAHVVGHSMGGQLAIHLAARHPEAVARLVLADAAGVRRHLGMRELLRFALELAPPRRWGDPRFFPVILRDALHAGPRSILRALGHILRDDVRPLLARIRAPTLVLWGEWDALVPLEGGRLLRARIPDARLAIVPRAAHNPMIDRPEAFNRLVLRFLRGEAVGE